MYSDKNRGMDIEFTVPIWEALVFSATSLAKNM